MFKFTRILTVVAMIMAMAAPTFGASVNGTVVVADGDTLAMGTGKAQVADTADTVLTVEVGGTFTADEELFVSEANGFTTDMYIYGVALIAQFKAYGLGAVTIVVGNGTDPATLTMIEGFLGKAGDASITINAGSTMAVSGTWQGIFKVDADAIGSDSYIDLVGGTLMVNALDTTVAVNIEPFLKGNGVLGEWVKTYDAGGFHGDGANIYTAAALVLPGTVIMFR
jgi:hypothetical protein